MNPDEALLCEPTYPNTDSPMANGTLESLNLAPGYWRSSNLSRDIRACPRSKSCPGGTEGRCAIGYDGTCECSDLMVMPGRCGWATSQNMGRERTCHKCAPMCTSSVTLIGRLKPFVFERDYSFSRPTARPYSGIALTHLAQSRDDSGISPHSCDPNLSLPR